MATNTLVVNFLDIPAELDIGEISEKLKIYFTQRQFDGSYSDGKPKVAMKFDGGAMYAVVTFASSTTIDKVLSIDDHNIKVDGQTIDLEIQATDRFDSSEQFMGARGPSCSWKSSSDQESWEKIGYGVEEEGAEDEEEEEESDEDENSNEASAIIMVSNFHNTSEETLRLYFESRRRSGGGDISDSNFDPEGNLVITFTSVKDAQGVLARRNHVLEGNTLTVLPVKKKKPRPYRPKDRRSLFLQGIADDVSNEMLTLYLENCSQIEEDPIIVYGEQPGTAMITYSSDIENLDAVIEKLKKRKLSKQTITASYVHVPDCILVTNLKPTMSLDMIELYFENVRRSGGGPVREVDFNEGDDFAIVYFENWQVVDRVAGRKHRLSDSPVSVSKHFECIGKETNVDSATPSLPKEYSITADKYLIAYLLQDKSPHKAKLLQSMAVVGADIVWPFDGKEDTVIVRPNPGKGGPIDPRHWKQQTSKILEKILNEFTTLEIAVLPQFWGDICKNVEKLRKDNVHPLFNDEECKILLRGPKDIVTTCETKIRKMQDELETAANIEKQRIKKTMKVSPEKFKVFVLCHIKEAVSQKFPNVNISIDSNSQTIVIEGQKSDTSEAQADIYSQFDRLVKQRVKISSIQAQFLLHVEDKIHEIFTSRNINAACQVNGEEAVVQGATSQDATRAATFITNDLEDDFIPFQDREIFQTGKGATILEDINQGKVVLTNIDEMKRQVEISGFKPDVSNAAGKIRQFVNENTEMTRFIPVQRGKLRFLDQHEASEIQQVSRNQQAHVIIQLQMKGPKYGIQITGTESGLQGAVQQLTTLSQGILERQHPITKPGIQELLNQPAGKHFMGKLERDYHCIVESGDGNEDLDGRPMMNVVKGRVQVLTSHVLSSGCQLKVCKGDITTERVDAIVNAANTDLRHVGGLARAIVKEGGDSIQRESEDILRNKGRTLHTSEAVVTGPGKLPCNHIIHVAGPRWSGSRGGSQSYGSISKEEDLLYDATKNVLVEAERRNLRSISIPAISSGIYKFPVDLCAKIIVEAVLDACDRRRKTILDEVRFTNNDQRSVDAFLDVFQQQFGKQQKIDTTANMRVGPKVDYGTVPSTTTGTGDVLTTAEGIRVTLVRGNIANQKVDVIVNTVGGSVQLTQGAVSNAIQSAAGTGLQKECDIALQQKKLTKLPAGDFIATGGGSRLPCQEVYHIVCDSFTSPNSEQTLGNLMQSVLNQAETNGHVSIAIPAIGTGNLGFPHKVTAQLMYEEALSFSQQSPSTSLKDIRFVVYEKDHITIKAFETELKNIRGRGGFQRRSSRNHKPLRKLKSQSDSFHSDPTSDEHSTAKTRVKIGTVIVELQQGDITKETTDIIVNSVGHNFGLRGPVSQAILRAGGDAIRRECEQIAAAGRLPCKTIIHIATPYDTRKLRETAGKALLLADQERAISIAFPALGTGVVSSGDDTHSAATALFDAIGEFAQDKPSYLRLVKIVIFKPDMFAEYVNAMTVKVEGGRGKNKGMLRRGFDIVWSALSGASSTDTDESWERPSDDIMILHIFAKNSHHLDRAINEIENFIRTEFFCEEVSVAEDLMSEIDEGKLRRIYAIGQKNKVEVIPMLDGRAKQISLQGRESAVRSVKADIMVYFMELHREKTKRAEDQLINKEVQWKYKDPTGIFVEYGDEINPLIERAHRAKQPYVSLEFDNGPAMIDFETMEESGMGKGASSSPIDVHRYDLKNENSFQVPAIWDSMNPGVQNIAVALQPGTEINNLQTKFQTAVGRQVTILKIERIQILDLYRRYSAIKERMQSSIPRSGQVQIERTLYQGVNHNITQKINSSGFDRADNQQQIQYIGNIGMGVYFSSNATCLDQSLPASGPQSRKYMYVCKVLTGELEQGRQGMISPSQNPNSPGNSFDCAVNNVQNPVYFVVFKDGQAYPEYLIEYQ